MKRKTIKKPKFLMFFLITLLITMTIGMIGTQWYLRSRIQEIADEDNEVVVSLVNNASQKIHAFVCSDEESYASCYNDLEWSMCLLRGAGVYASVYINEEKILDNKDVAPMMIALGQETTEQETKIKDFYFLADMSLLDPLNEYENGKYSLKKQAKTSAILENDILAEELSNEKIYGYNLTEIYIDPETHRFYPGVIEVTDTDDWHHPVLASIDCSTEKAKTLTRVARADFKFLYTGFVNHYYDESKETEEIELYSEPLTGYGNNMRWELHCSVIPRSGVLEVLPVTFWVVLGVAMSLALLLSLTISVIRYFRAKAVWVVFDNQKKMSEAMAHDLKTPLATISAYAEKLEDQIAFLREGDTPAEVSSFDAEKATVNAAKIRENVSEMNSMLEGILEFSKTDRTARAIKKEKIDLRELVETSAAKSKVIFEKRGINVTINGDDITLTTDRDLLLQAIDNLFTNCGKYAEESSVVEVTIEAKRLQISNRTSEPVSNVEELKTPFVKGEKARGQNGTGLGLAIADNNLLLLGYSLDLKYEDEMFIATISF
ncbi:MAG: HAMP domain-containing histidine kinase [Lachnospiraceae bacterium]|nr:HAMP domain-containing histidine kinase [Clostridiales bacterium]MBR4010274.1 HAMP domain-containing histidine kinase [Clostridiales bacterium]MBR6849974.1 HAMP domain-containing histidine kinase [Lachnospiraceae bacterium]